MADEIKVEYQEPTIDIKPTIDYSSIDGRPDVLKLLGYIEPAAATATMTVNFVAGYEMLFFQLLGKGISGAGLVSIYFNGDTGTNYHYKVSEDLGAFTESTTAAGIDLSISDDANTAFFQGHIQNNKTYNKYTTGNGLRHASVGTTTLFYGSWNNTTDYITSVTATLSSARTYGVGSKLYIYGA